jgi:hypothetical protein
MAIEHTEKIGISAPGDRVWATYTDVEKWHEWTGTTDWIERLDDGPLALGRTARVKLKGAPASVWTVTEFTDGRSFTWESSSAGMRSVAWHVVEAKDGETEVTLGIRMTGLTATLLYPLFRYIAKRNLRLEAAGLKQRCEAT